MEAASNTTRRSGETASKKEKNGLRAAGDSNERYREGALPPIWTDRQKAREKKRGGTTKNCVKLARDEVAYSTPLVYVTTRMYTPFCSRAKHNQVFTIDCRTGVIDAAAGFPLH